MAPINEYDVNNDVKLGRTSRAQAVVEYVENQILDGRWNPGDRVEDSVIAKELGVSRNSVREAMAQLVALRVLEKQQWRGYYIPALTWEEIEHTVDIRKGLETLALRLFLSLVTPEAMEEIAESLRQSQQDMETENLIAFEKSDYLIHEIIHRRCGNPWIPHLISQTKFFIDRLRRLDKKDHFRDVAEASIAEHWLIWEAIRDGNSDEAIRILEAQIERHRKRLWEVYTEHSEAQKQ